MIFPTLEQIAATPESFEPHPKTMIVLARELLAVREWIEAFEAEEMLEAFQRIAAVEGAIGLIDAVIGSMNEDTA